MVDAARLRRALVGHEAPPDPNDVVVPVAEPALPEGWRERRIAGARHAAILVPFVDTGDGLEVVLTERAAHLKHHPGQVSFPGGAAEPHDANLAATALRETEEEVGIQASRVEVLGYLRPQWTISGYTMTPVIGLVSGAVSLMPDPSEVATAFQVPAAHLFDVRQHRHFRREYDGFAFDALEIQWREHRIWGATAGVIERLHRVIERQD
ncbi:MAG: CoA pyrophosphatase [Pseudomonadota bacterium]